MHLSELAAAFAEERRFTRQLVSIVKRPQPERATPPSRESLERFARRDKAQASSRVDEQTVGDLELHAAMKTVFEPCAKAGHYAAYAALVQGRLGAEGGAHASLRAEVRQNALALAPLLQPLRHCPDDPLPFLFLGANHRLPAWADHLILVPLLMLVSIALIASGALAPAGWLGLALAVLATGYVQIRLHASLVSWKAVRNGLCTVLRTAASMDGWIVGRLPGLDKLRVVHASLQRSRCLEWLNDYLNLLFLREYRAMPADVGLALRHIEAIREAYLLCARVDALEALATAPGRLGLPWADVEHPAAAAAGTLQFTSVVHPGLDSPLPFSSFHASRGGTFISGRNAAGKSTLLRAVGTNALFLRAFGGAFCTHCAGGVTGVVSAIAAVDSMADRESLYYAELRRCREILAAVAAAPDMLVLIDEPFRGTNNLESLAASASVLEHAAPRSTLVVVTHNVLMCGLLPAFQRLQVRHAPRTITVEPGVLADPNGLALFDDVIADPHLSNRARHWFEHLGSAAWQAPAAAPS